MCLQLRVVPAPKGPDGACLTRRKVPKHEWASAGLDEPMPFYGDGVYDTSRCLVHSSEEELFPKRAVAAQLGATMRQTLVRYISQQKAVAGEVLPPPNASDDELRAFIRAKIQAPNELMSQNRVVPYDPVSGVQVYIDGMLNVPDQVIVKAAVSLCLPGKSVSEPSSIKYTALHTWSSPIKFQAFDDERMVCTLMLGWWSSAPMCRKRVRVRGCVRVCVCVWISRRPSPALCATAGRSL